MVSHEVLSQSTHQKINSVNCWRNEQKAGVTHDGAYVTIRRTENTDNATTSPYNYDDK